MGSVVFFQTTMLFNLGGGKVNLKEIFKDPLEIIGQAASSQHSKWFLANVLLIFSHALKNQISQQFVSKLVISESVGSKLTSDVKAFIICQNRKKMKRPAL